VPAPGIVDWRNARREKGPDKPESNRTPGQRDRDRILYSPAFRRLQAVTQVILAADEGYLQHNRLTHSLKVAQVGRRIAELLKRTYTTRAYERAIERRGGLDPDVVEAASLAHDLGHPPFGHIAEQRLQELMQGEGLRDSFEGNAQSFRIVTRLSAIDPDYLGLDLTRATLNAILKYPWLREGRESKWGAYETEKDVFAWAREDRFEERERSLEADIMDWADDIAYAVHDVEDFFRVGLIPLGSLRTRHERLPEIFDRVAAKLSAEKNPDRQVAASIPNVKNAWSETISSFGVGEYDETRLKRAALYQYTSGLR
jgi:dGTPase